MSQCTTIELILHHDTMAKRTQVDAENLVCNHDYENESVYSQIRAFVNDHLVQLKKTLPQGNKISIDTLRNRPGPMWEKVPSSLKGKGFTSGQISKRWELTTVYMLLHSKMNMTFMVCINGTLRLSSWLETQKWEGTVYFSPRMRSLIIWKSTQCFMRIWMIQISWIY